MSVVAHACAKQCTLAWHMYCIWHAGLGVFDRSRWIASLSPGGLLNSKTTMLGMSHDANKSMVPFDAHECQLVLGVLLCRRRSLCDAVSSSKQGDWLNTQSVLCQLMTLTTAGSCWCLSMALGHSIAQYRSQYLQHRSHHISSLPMTRSLLTHFLHMRGQPQQHKV